MRTRKHYYKRESSLADSDTTIIDITNREPISYLKIEVEATNGATSCLNHSIKDDVSLIELVDGADVIASLSMEDWIGLNSKELGKLPHALLSEVGGDKQEQSCYIHFGRFQDDPRFYLRPDSFKNLQLRITHSLTISSTAGFATGTGKITVMAEIIEDGAEVYAGYLSAKEKYSWTAATSGDELIPLPTDNPYRLLVVKAKLSGYTPDAVLSQLKLSLDADSQIPFNVYTEDVIDDMERRDGQLVEVINNFSADDDSVNTNLFDVRQAHARANVDDHMATVEAITAEQVQLGLYDLSTPGTPAFQTTAKACQIDTRGLCYAGHLNIPFGNVQDEKSWFDARDWHDIKLYATQLAAGACKVILQQHVV